jgi:DNA-binding IclR family transcriptional regulator
MARGSRLADVDGRAADSAGGNYHTHALTRGLGILESLAASADPVTLAELHEDIALPKSTLVRLLSDLVRAEFAVRVDERPAYRLGHKVMVLANSYVKSLDISQVAGGYLADLAASTRQTSNLGVLDGDQVLHVCVEVPDRPLRFETATGSRAPAYSTGLGKMLLASLADASVDAHLPAGHLPAVTPRTLTDRAQLARELAKTARRGYALDDNEHSEGLRCLSVPVVADGTVIAAVSVSGPAAEFGAAQQPTHLKHLRATAYALAGDPEVVDALLNVRVGA